MNDVCYLCDFAKLTRSFLHLKRHYILMILMSFSHVFLFLYCMAFDVLPYSYSQFLSIITQFSLDTAKPEFPLIYFMIKLSL